MTDDILWSETRRLGTATVVLLVFEKYYWRVGNRASLSVLLTQEEGEDIHIDAISAGGGKGFFFSFSLGAEENYISLLEKVLRRRGFFD